MLRQKPSLWLMVMVFFVLIMTNLGVPLASQPIAAQKWTYSDGYDPHGGYLDRVTFVVYPPEDEQLGLQALQANIIYAWDENVPADNIAEIETVAGLNIISEPSDRYRMFCLNCGRFPTNITAYRQAIAYALDKVAVIQASTGGLAFLQDCALPINLGNWTFENILVETHYYQDVDKANATLEAAGFRDLDGNGWRDFDANNNSILDGEDILDYDFAVELYHTAGHAPAGNAVELAADGLNLCGIMASVASQDFYDMLDLIEVADYWMSCFTFSDVNSPEFLYDMFHSSTANSDWFFGGYNNSVYDMYVENMMAASTQEEANEWAWLCQYQLWEDLPMIVCYNEVITHAYRTDCWEGYINMATQNRICNGYSLVQIRLKEDCGGPWGCIPTEYIMSLQEGLDTTNWLMSYSDHADKVFQLIYEGLWTISPYDLEPQPALAYTWEIEPTMASGDIQNGEMYTFHLYENATWHDGTPVTTTDVAFSLSLGLLDPYDSDNYENVYMTNIIDSYTIEIYTNATGYFEWIRATDFIVYPAHIWSLPNNILTWEPAIPELVGSGPYIFTGYIPGQYVVLERHHVWHFAMEMPLRPDCGWGPPPGYYLLITIGIIVIIIQVGILGFLLFKRWESKSKFKAYSRS